MVQRAVEGIAEVPQVFQRAVEGIAEVPDVEGVAWLARRLVPRAWEQVRTVQRQMGQTVQLTKYKFEKEAVQVSLPAAAPGSFADVIFLCLTEVICWPGNTAVHQEDLGYEVFLTLNGTCDALDARPLVQIPRCQFLPTVSHHF